MLFSVKIAYYPTIFFFFLFILFPLLCGVDDIHLHHHVVRSYTSSPDRPFIPRPALEPSSVRSSSQPSPLHFHFHRTLSYIVLVSSHHMPIYITLAMPINEFVEGNSRLLLIFRTTTVIGRNTTKLPTICHQTSKQTRGRQ